MPKKGHTEEQIVAVLRPVEAGARVEEVCRKAGISEATYYLWKRQYSGVGVSELRELRQLREENGAAEAAGGGSQHGPADSPGDRLKKAVRPRARRKLARWALEAYRISERRAARIVRLGISTLRYQSRKVFDEVLRRRLRELAGTYVRYGYRRLTVLLRREGWKVNAKRIYRLYREEELIVRTKQRRKIARRQRVPTPLATRANQCWSMDFVSDKFADGSSFRILTVIDQFTRECVALEADRSMTGPKVAEALERARQERGRLPESITVDNGSEFSGRALEAWAMTHQVQLCFIRPGRPVENGFIESFNGRLRDECLNVEWFSSRDDARQKLGKFREHYNQQRPHSSLADRAPAVFAELCKSKEASPQMGTGEEAQTPPLPPHPHPAGTGRGGNFSLLLEALECGKSA